MRALTIVLKVRYHEQMLPIQQRGAHRSRFPYKNRPAWSVSIFRSIGIHDDARDSFYSREELPGMEGGPLINDNSSSVIMWDCLYVVMNKSLNGTWSFEISCWCFTLSHWKARMFLEMLQGFLWPPGLQNVCRCILRIYRSTSFCSSKSACAPWSPSLGFHPISLCFSSRPYGPFLLLPIHSLYRGNRGISLGFFPALPWIPDFAARFLWIWGCRETFKNKSETSLWTLPVSCETEMIQSRGTAWIVPVSRTRMTALGLCRQYLWHLVQYRIL